ncbi:DUF2529 domain-containing protein [Bacillus sp. T33-2]|uniref:DUF2529 domain-containing protein n=1 Tax=Bacillus sp. T33-2 TaxID=2054168 RepID=UPI000C79071C|nr:DUF2529 domain-containing protein [Bacillus sp. T33-2]PLR96600.1 DUF2529 domain-containing protein [Bacillus sp. T33-2]
MIKMFSTQLTGIFKRLQEKQEFAIEDGARLLAQASAGEGNIFIYGKAEMAAVPFEAVEGAEPLLSAKIFNNGSLEELTDADRVLIIARKSDDEDAVGIAEALVGKRIPFVAVSTAVPEAAEELSLLADVHIDLGMKKGLLPDEHGNRVGMPTSIAALFVYFALKFTVEEILEEYA